MTLIYFDISKVFAIKEKRTFPKIHDGGAMGKQMTKENCSLEKEEKCIETGKSVFLIVFVSDAFSMFHGFK